jgi:putative hydrolase of the HAD superfamily
MHLLDNIRAIVFDAVGTLIHPEPPAAAVYAEVAQRFGSALTTGDIAPRFAAAFARQEQLDRDAGLRTSEERELQRWRDIVAEVLGESVSRNGAFDELYEHFARPTAWRCGPGTVDVLDALAARGYRLALASNFDHRLRSVVAGLPELYPLQDLIISSEIGWRKPAQEFFAAVRRAVREMPPHILFVGDDEENDYLGATGAGMRAMLFHSGQGEGGLRLLMEIPSA